LEVVVDRLSDDELMESLARGDREAYGVLLQRYWARLVVYAAEIVDGQDQAQDVAQDTFIQLWRYRERWVTAGNVGAYLYRITRNLALNAVRQERASARRIERSAERNVNPPSPTTPEESLDEALLRQHVEAALNALPERRREVFILARFHGLSHEEIATAMEISRQTVANQMSLALSQLQRLLSPRLPDV
jgi:RNA polymerase sigma-70 factor, ECF subfamily